MNTLEICSPDDPRLGYLHPDVPWGCDFYADGLHWPQVARYLLGYALADDADRRAISQATDLAQAKALSRTMARRPDAEAQREAALRRAVSLAFTKNLRPRAVLLGTGDDALALHLGEDAYLGVGPNGRGENALGRALMAVRAELRRVASDPTAIQCAHPDVDPEFVRRVCVHLLAGDLPRHRRFTGQGASYELLCEACAAALPRPAPSRTVCSACLRSQLHGPRLLDLGAPESVHHPSRLRFVHRTFEGPRDVIALAPIARRPSAWLMLDSKGHFWFVDTRAETARPGGQLDPASIDLEKPVVLCAAPGGELAAVGEAYGLRAAVLEPESGAVVRTLVRGEYQVENCHFPLALFEYGGRVLLLHATDWNRLDVTCPRTGERLTPREEPRLDYFHSDLHLSPNGTLALTNGWIWHPFGQVRTFSVSRWLDENPYESEDGPSLTDLAGRAYYWDGPVAWLDERTVALWGEGDDADEMIPAALIYDALTGQLVRSFRGPGQGLLSVPPHLVSYDDHRGAEVWDWRQGERLAADPALVPEDAHPLSRELLSRIHDGVWRVSTLTDDEPLR